jgi:hypothetical protein
MMSSILKGARPTVVCAELSVRWSKGFATKRVAPQVSTAVTAIVDRVFFIKGTGRIRQLNMSVEDF